MFSNVFMLFWIELSVLEVTAIKNPFEHAYNHNDLKSRENALQRPPRMVPELQNRGLGAYLGRNRELGPYRIDFYLISRALLGSENQMKINDSSIFLNTVLGSPFGSRKLTGH